jgi:hypothetical protein
MFLLYLLKVSACVLGFYTLYLLAFRKFTFFGWNRGYLMASLVLSFLIPMIKLEETVVMPIQSQEPESEAFNGQYILPNQDFSAINQLPIQDISEPFDWQNALLFLYFLGVTLFLIKLIFSLYKVYQRSRNAIRLDKYSIIEGCNENASFFNVIFLNVEGLSTSEKEQIIAHEATHARLLHSIDILILAICKVVLWFNPVIYYFKKSLSQIHEYEVDTVMIRDFDSKNYAYLLLKLGTNPHISLLTNQFSTQPLKDRIQFLFSKRTKFMKKLFYVFILPLIGISVWAFAGKTVKVVYEDVKKIIKNEIRQLNDSTIIKTLKDSTQTNYTKSDTGLAQPNFKIDTLFRFYDGWRYIFNDDEFFIHESKRDENGELIYRVTINKPMILSNNNQGFAVNLTYKENEKPLYLIDNQIVSEEIVRNFTAEDMKKVFQMNGIDSSMDLVGRLGERARGYIGAICIWTEDLRNKQYKDVPQSDSIRTIISTHKLGKNPLVLINGIEYPASVLYRIDPRVHHSNSIYPPNSEIVIKKYGEKARDGVLVIDSSDDLFLKSDLAYQTVMENIRRELAAPAGHLVRIQQLNEDKTTYDKVIVRNQDGSVRGAIEIKTGGEVFYAIDGKQVSESDIRNYNGKLIGISCWEIKGDGAQKIGIEGKYGKVALNYLAGINVQTK